MPRTDLPGAKPGTPGAHRTTVVAPTRGRRLAAATAILAILLGLSSPGWATDENWAWSAANAPAHLPDPDGDRPVVVAIVDDGFRLSHEALVEFVWDTPGEIPGNGRDDDGNGFPDDIGGWDVSDGDNDVSPPEDRLAPYSHGTQVAGIVTQLARRAWGNAAPSAIRILPVKAMSDDAEKPYIREGFAGIRYAVNAGADIVITAWGVNQVSLDETRILQEAADRGVLVVASAGNFPQELEQYPAAFRAVLAVAATGPSGRKLEASAYGQFIDLTAPGVSIRTASATGDDAWETVEGTSYAAAITGAAAALVRAENPDLTSLEIDACLKGSALAPENPPADLRGKLGAGRLNIAAAMACASLRQPPRPRQILIVSKGFLNLRAASGSPVEWIIESPGEINGIRFWPGPSTSDQAGGRLAFRAGRPGSDRPVTEHALADLPESVFVADRTAIVRLEPSTEGHSDGRLLEYEFDTIDFSKRFCSGTQRIRTEGVIGDGSGPRDYAPGSDCKWLITAPPGHVIHLRFLEFDTESRTDFVYVFNGAGTHEDIMARFSGPDLPPEFTSWGNEALMWFVTDRATQGKGWTVEVSFRKAPP